MSRSKLVSLISNGDVRVNWTTVTKHNTTINIGYLISVSGKGKLKKAAKLHTSASRNVSSWSVPITRKKCFKKVVIRCGCQSLKKEWQCQQVQAAYHSSGRDPKDASKNQ